LSEINKILLSIVAPIRNEKEYILELINSFSKVDDDRLELLISNNHSDDGSDELLKNIKYKNIKIIKPEIKLSPFDNHIFAINHSKGQFIFPIGGDDYISPETLKNVLDILEPGVIIVPRLRSFDDSSRETIETTNLKKDLTRFFTNNKFSILKYLKFINYDQLIFIICERKNLKHLNFIRPNTIESFAVWSNIFVFSNLLFKDIVFLDSILMHKRYNKSYISAGFANDQYAETSMLERSINSITNTLIYFKKTRNFLETFYLLFLNRYAVGFYRKKIPTQKVTKLLTFAPIFMIFLSPILIIKNLVKSKLKNLNKLN
jgi:glycosyltransferase involved in cell wall biosynthesis